MANNESKIDLQAEKTAFSDVIINSTPPVQGKMESSVAPLKFEMPKSESLGQPMSMVPMNSQPNQGFDLNNMSKMNSPLESNPMKIEGMKMPLETPSIGFQPQQPMLSLTPAQNPPVNSILMNKQLMPEQTFLKKTQDLEHTINKNIMPTIKNLAQNVNEMSVTNKGKVDMSQEYPTNPPSNLMFADKIESIYQYPHWA